MIKLFEIIKKNFRLLIRSKTSALIVLVGPLVLMLLIGFAFNTSSIFDIKIGTYSSSYSELSNSINDKLTDEQFRVLKLDSEERCIDAIKTGEVHVCTIYPADLNLQTSDKIIFYVDQTRLNFVYIILDRISSKIATKSTELSTALTNRLLTSLNNANTKLSEKGGIVVELTTNLKDAKELTTDIKDQFLSVELNVSKSNFTELKNEIDDIKQKENLSASLFRDLDDLVEDVEDNYDNLVLQLESVASIRNSAETGLGALENKLAGNIQDSVELKNTIDEINQDINSIEIKDVARIVSPISTEIKPIVAESTNLSYTFPTLVILVVLFAGVLIGATTIQEEKSSKAYFRNFITPTHDILFILGNYLSNLIIIVIQLLIIFAVMLYITKTSVVELTLLNIFVLLAIVASVFILLGMLIGYLFRSNETSNIAAISVSALLLFFSNTILPLETLPTAIRGIVSFNPFIIGEASLKKVLLFNESLTSILPSIYTLIGYIALLVVLVYITRELTKRWFS
ncbi:MAG: ABC transporter permease [Nanoarchaeota archaeon]